MFGLCSQQSGFSSKAWGTCQAQAPEWMLAHLPDQICCSWSFSLRCRGAWCIRVMFVAYACAQLKNANQTLMLGKPTAGMGMEGLVKSTGKGTWVLFINRVCWAPRAKLLQISQSAKCNLTTSYQICGPAYYFSLLLSPFWHGCCSEQLVLGLRSLCTDDYCQTQLVTHFPSMHSSVKKGYTQVCTALMCLA